MALEKSGFVEVNNSDFRVNRGKILTSETGG